MACSWNRNTTLKLDWEECSSLVARNKDWLLQGLFSESQKFYCWMKPLQPLILGARRYHLFLSFHVKWEWAVSWSPRDGRERVEARQPGSEEAFSSESLSYQNGEWISSQENSRKMSSFSYFFSIGMKPTSLCLKQETALGRPFCLFYCPTFFCGENKMRWRRDTGMEILPLSFGPSPYLYNHSNYICCHNALRTQSSSEYLFSI